MIWVLFALGILLVACCFGYTFLGLSSVRWPTTRGKVLFSEFLERTVHGRTTYRPRLVYEYTVNGVSRESHQIGFYAAIEGKEWAERLLSAKPVGAEVTVYYSPMFPKVSVLEPGIKQTWIWLFLAAIGGLAALSSGVALFGDNPNALLDFVFGLF